MWQGHANARVAPKWHDNDGLAGDGPTGIVGPGYSIGVVMHLRYIALPFILTKFTNFTHVGLCSLLFS